MNGSDPTGLYEEDVHRYLTEYLAWKAGFRREIAILVGDQTQQLDNDGRAAIIGNRPAAENMEQYHFVSPERLLELRSVAIAYPSLDSDLSRIALGEFLHALEDTYSHQADDSHRDFEAQFRTKSGHFFRGHAPDWTWGERSGLAMGMAEDVYRHLSLLCQHMLGAKCRTVPFEQVRGRIDDFLNFEPQLFEDRFGGIVPTQGVVDYTEKVHRLDSSIVMRGTELVERRSSYAAFRDRESSLQVGMAAPRRASPGIRERAGDLWKRLQSELP